MRRSRKAVGRHRPRRSRLRGLGLAVGLVGCAVCGTACGPAVGPHAQDPHVEPIRGTWHTVGRGDTVAAVAQRYGVPPEDIEEINGVDRGARLEAGRRLFVPGAAENAEQGRGGRPADGGPAGVRAPAGQRGDSGPGWSTTPADATRARRPARLLWPVAGGKVTSVFGERGKRRHEGVDIAAPEGTAIVAAADGVVIYAGSGVRGYGNMVIVKHGGGLVTVYAHNKRNLVQEGTRVSAGQVIAEVGSTGRASGSHVHFEVRRGETPFDPMPLLKAR